MPRSYYIYGLPENIEDFDPEGEIPRMPIGDRATVLRGLSQLNTSPDVPGSSTLYGPGIEISLPEGDGVLDFAVLRVSDDTISWPVMLRIAGEMGWCMWDPDENRNLYRLKRRHDDLS
ncbi:MAG: hypothetical protein RL005_1448 [Planctomycetota bacterium]